MKVGIATGDWVEHAVTEDGEQILGGSGHIRLGQYIPYSAHDISIGELAWHVDDEIFGLRDWQGNELWDFDILIFQRWMHFSIPARIKIAQSKGQIIVNDLDDWYWGLSEKNLAFKASHPRVNPDENINHYRKTLGRSDAVIASTAYLAERISKFVRKDRIHLMPNHVELDKFRQWEHTESERPVIGWMGATGHRSGDLDILKREYALLEQKHPGEFAYHHSGHIGWMEHFYSAVGLEKDDVTILMPVPAPQLGQQMRFDIGVVPLVKAPFNDAKSWIKGLEYAAAGIPFIASDSQPYRDLKEQYNVGLIAKKGGDWERMFMLLKDPQARIDIAEQNLANIESLDVKYGAARWDYIINEIAS